MPVDIASLKKRGVKVNVEFYGDQIPVTYDPITVSSPAFREEYNARSRQLQRAYGEWIRDEVAAFNATEIPENFPQRERLIEAGYETFGDIPKSVAALQEAFSDLEESDARRIVNEMNRISRFEPLDLERQRWAMEAELAVMLIKDWEFVEAGEPIPVDVEAFTSGVLPPQLARAIIDAIWEDASALGNPNGSGRSRSG